MTDYATHENPRGDWEVRETTGDGLISPGFDSQEAAVRHLRLLYLEDAVAFLREHPELDFNPVDVAVVVPERYELPEEEQKAATIAELSDLTRTLASGGTAKKSYSDDLVSVTRKFGPHSIRALAWSRNVCERVQVGEQVIPASPERTVPVYETKCPPLLDEPA